MEIDINQFFREVTLRISSSLDLQKAASRTLEYLRLYIPADAISILYVDLAQKKRYDLAKVQQKGSSIFNDLNKVEISLDETFLNRYKHEEEKEISLTVHNRPEQYFPEVIRNSPHLLSCSCMRLLLDISHQVLGHLVLFAEGHDRYTATHKALLEIVKEPIAIAVSNARRYQELLKAKNMLADDNRALTADIRRNSGVAVVGADFGLREVMNMVRQVAPSNSPVLLLGETGSGKEVIANAVHLASPRSSAPLISLQCGAAPETLLDSELFGHEKGAFTGASERKRGRFERADRGTLFLDEIGELSPNAQVKLLRVLQEKKFERVGGTRTIEVDVRVVAATHRDLEKMVKEGKFREDLWYRLNVLPIRIPPLRYRRDDIPVLVQYFVKRKAQEMNLESVSDVDSHTLDRLKQYDWPGNVRELQNIVERALILARDGEMIFPELDSGLNHHVSRGTFQQKMDILPLDKAMAIHIRRALNETKGKISGKGGAAELLRINEGTLRARMKKLGVRKGWKIR